MGELFDIKMDRLLHFVSQLLSSIAPFFPSVLLQQVNTIVT